MLIDDNKIDNFFHERVIKKHNTDITVVAKECAEDGLEYIKAAGNTLPDVIFLDINMPGMNGWEFIAEYNKLDKSLQSAMIVVMAGLSYPNDDRLPENTSLCIDFKTKPLTQNILQEVYACFTQCNTKID